jgi:hypothetical protein
MKAGSMHNAEFLINCVYPAFKHTCVIFVHAVISTVFYQYDTCPCAMHNNFSFLFCRGRHATPLSDF